MKLGVINIEDYLIFLEVIEEILNLQGGVEIFDR